MNKARLSNQWLDGRIALAHSYWESRVPASELFAKCVERVMLMITEYREGEDPEQYREYIEAQLQSRMSEAH